MASIVSAGTTSATALNMSADTSGVLQLASNNGVVALTITTAGNVGVGTTTPVNNGGYGGFTLNGTSGAIASLQYNGTENLRLFAGSGQASIQYGTGGFLSFTYGVSGGTEVGRFDSSGSLGVNITSPSTYAKIATASTVVLSNDGTYGLSLSDATTLGKRMLLGYYGTGGNGYGVIQSVYTGTAWTDTAINPNGGNLLVGTTSSAYSGSTYNTIAKSTSSIQLALQRTGSGAGYSGIGADDTYLLNVYDSGTTKRFAVTNGGSCQNYTGSYAAFSDLKLKENIEPARGYLADLQRVNVVKYSLKADKQSKANMLGVIAQELEQIFPSMVEENSDFDSAGEKLETTTKTVKYSIFVPMLVKAIQELNAKVEALQAKVGA
jgi:hypothetical protein